MLSSRATAAAAVATDAAADGDPPRRAAAHSWTGPHMSAEGEPYYHHEASGKRQWEKPDEMKTECEKALERRCQSSAWKVAFTAAGKAYYYNETTKVTTWKMPEEPKVSAAAAAANSAKTADANAALNQLRVLHGTQVVRRQYMATSTALALLERTVLRPSADAEQQAAVLQQQSAELLRAHYEAVLPAAAEAARGAHAALDAFEDEAAPALLANLEGQLTKVLEGARLNERASKAEAAEEARSLMRKRKGRAWATVGREVAQAHVGGESLPTLGSPGGSSSGASEATRAQAPFDL